MCVLHRDRVATLYRFFVLNCYSPTCNFRGVGDIPSPEPTHPENRDFFLRKVAVLTGSMLVGGINIK